MEPLCKMIVSISIGFVISNISKATGHKDTEYGITELYKQDSNITIRDPREVGI